MSFRCGVILLCLCALCGRVFSESEPLAVRNARDKYAADQKAALVNYYKTMAAAEQKKLQTINGMLQKEKAPELITMLAGQVKEATEINTFYASMASGSATFQVVANKTWQSTIKVKAGMIVQVWGQGVWCSDVKKRATHTYDADGEAGHDFAYLAAKVGGGPSERVGKYRCFPIVDDGDLTFEMHDAGKGDNDGVLSVTVAVLPPTDTEGMEQEQKDVLIGYYKAMTAAGEKQLRDLATAIGPSRDASFITAITEQMYRVREALAFHSAMAEGKAGYKISAAKTWQPTIRVTKGTMVHVYAVGTWCSAVSDRKAHTYDAEGVIGKEFAYLAGRIGEGESFRVGRSKTIKVADDGELSFEMHDTGKNDNDGELTVYISLEKAPGFQLDDPLK